MNIVESKLEEAEATLMRIVDRASALRVSGCHPTSEELQYFEALGWDTSMVHRPHINSGVALYRELSRCCNVRGRMLQAGTGEQREQLLVDLEKARDKQDVEGEKLRKEIQQRERKLAKLDVDVSSLERRQLESGQALNLLSADNTLPRFVMSEITARLTALRNSDLYSALRETLDDGNRAKSRLKSLRSLVNARRNVHRPDVENDETANRRDEQEIGELEGVIADYESDEKRIRAEIAAEEQSIAKLRSFYWR